MGSGILILAPANSIGDYVADTALAKNGKFATAFGAVYSGPLLNLLVGIGLSCTISTLANGIPVPLARTAVEVGFSDWKFQLLKYSAVEYHKWLKS